MLGDQEQSERKNKGDTLRQLDSLPLSRWHILLAVALGFVWIFDGYEVSLVSLLRPRIVLAHSVDFYALLITAYQVGCIIGAFVFGIAAALFGRSCVFLVTLAVYSLGTLLSAIPTTNCLFLAARFLTGVSVGGQFTAIFTAVDEFMPPSHRGRINIAIDGTWHLGGTLASLLILLVDVKDQWRLLFILGIIGVPALILIRWNVPQSPRWLLLRSRLTQAEQTVNAIEMAVYNNRWCLGRIVKEKGRVMTAREYLRQLGAAVRIGMKQHTMKMCVAICLMFSQAFFFNLIYYEYPATLTGMGLSEREIGLYMLPLSLVSFVSTLVVGPLFDVLSRRVMLLITYCGSAVLLPFTALFTGLEAMEVAVCVLFLLSSPAASAANLVASEVFPTAARTVMLFFMFVISILGGMCGVWLRFTLLASALMFIAGVLAYFKCPPAERCTLEQVQLM